MYLQHFRLTEPPFAITPDTSFFYPSASSQRALNTLLVATREGEGFIKITGEVGTGKTLLCRQLLASLGPQWQTAYLPNPTLEPMAMLLALAEELGVRTYGLNHVPSTHQHALMRALQQRLLALAQADKRVLVCLDEVQAMPIETLEVLRLLTNLETEKRKLMQVVIFGQPELNEKLDQPQIRQLKQRITFHYHLDVLSRSEMRDYLNHRLAVAGYRGPELFSLPALWLMKWRTGGVPRLVNVVAHKALMCAYGRGRYSVGLMDMREAVADTLAVQFNTRRLALGGLILCSLGAVAVAARVLGPGLARIV